MLQYWFKHVPYQLLYVVEQTLLVETLETTEHHAACTQYLFTTFIISHYPSDPSDPVGPWVKNDTFVDPRVFHEQKVNDLVQPGDERGVRVLQKTSIRSLQRTRLGAWRPPRSPQVWLARSTALAPPGARPLGGKESTEELCLVGWERSMPELQRRNLHQETTAPKLEWGLGQDATRPHVFLALRQPLDTTFNSLNT